MSFTVQPDALRRVGREMRTLADSVTHAGRYVESYVQLEHHNGTVLAMIGEHVNSIQSYLMVDYGPAGDATSAYRGFGDAMDAIAHDYQTTDGAQAARYDRLMDDVDITQEELPKTLQAPTVRLEDYIGRFAVAPENGFADIEVYNKFAQGVDYVVSFKWLGQFFSAVGITDPFAQFKKELEGDWKKVGTAVGALKAVTEYWSEVGFDTRAMPNNFHGAWIGDRFRTADEGGVSASWSGNAADAATRHLFDLAGTVESHRSNIDNRIGTITAQMFYANDLLDQLIGLIEPLLAIMPDGSKVDDWAKILLSPKLYGKTLFEIAKFVARFLTRFRLLIDAVAVVMAAFSLLASLCKPDFPKVAYAVPDVNGPAGFSGAGAGW